MAKSAKLGKTALGFRGGERKAAARPKAKYSGVVLEAADRSVSVGKEPKPLGRAKFELAPLKIKGLKRFKPSIELTIFETKNGFPILSSPVKSDTTVNSWARAFKEIK